jgi:hypothetical protein
VVPGVAVPDPSPLGRSTIRGRNRKAIPPLASSGDATQLSGICRDVAVIVVAIVGAAIAEEVDDETAVVRRGQLTPSLPVFVMWTIEVSHAAVWGQL